VAPNRLEHDADLPLTITSTDLLTLSVPTNKVTQNLTKKRPEEDDFMNRFIFSVETAGAMDAEDILMINLRVLKEKLNDLADSQTAIKEQGE